MTAAQTIGRRIADGALWMVGFKLADRFIGLLSTLVLARLLTPADFGIVAMATAFIALLELATWFSFDLALIQNQQASRAHYDSAWTMNAIVALSMGAIMVLAAPYVASFYRTPPVAPILQVLAVGILAQGLENVGTVAFRKELNLRKEFAFLFTKRMIAVTIGIALAIALRSYWALVAGMVAGRVAGVALSYVIHPYRPRFDLSRSRELMGFSKWIWLNGALNFVNFRAADFFIGRMSGPGALGAYSLGYEIANLPTSEMAAPLSRAVFPGYALVANDAGAIRRTFIGVFGVLALVAVPAGLGIAAIADPIVNVLLGEAWRAAVPIIELVAVAGVLVALASNASYVCLAAGQPRRITALIALHTAVLLPALAVLVPAQGAIGAAWAIVGAASLSTPVALATAAQVAGIRAGAMLATMARPAIAGVVMYFLVKHAAGYVGAQGIFALLALVGLGAASYAGVLATLWLVQGRPDGAESAVLSRLGLRRETIRDGEGSGS